jgi:hypothetical protein
MSAARFGSMQRVEAHQFPQLEKVGDASGLLESLIQLDVATRHVDVAPELLSQLRNLLERGS